MDALSFPRIADSSIRAYHIIADVTRKISQLVLRKKRENEELQISQINAKSLKCYADSTELFRQALIENHIVQTKSCIGNGYYEALKSLLTEIGKIEAETPNYSYLIAEVFEKDFKEMLLQEKTHYPVPIYFIAFDILYRKTSPVTSLWTVTINPKMQTVDAAFHLIVSSHAFFFAIRQEMQAGLKEALHTFDQAWRAFITELALEYTQNQNAWIGTRSIRLLIDALTASEDNKWIYRLKRKQVDNIAKKFFSMEGEEKEDFLVLVHYHMGSNAVKTPCRKDENSELFIASIFAEEKERQLEKLAVLGAVKWAFFSDEPLPPAAYLDIVPLLQTMRIKKRCAESLNLEELWQLFKTWYLTGKTSVLNTHFAHWLKYCKIEKWIHDFMQKLPQCSYLLLLIQKMAEQERITQIKTRFDAKLTAQTLTHLGTTYLDRVCCQTKLLECPINSVSAPKKPQEELQ